MVLYSPRYSPFLQIVALSAIQESSHFVLPWKALQRHSTAPARTLIFVKVLLLSYRAVVNSFVVSSHTNRSKPLGVYLKHLVGSLQFSVKPFDSLPVTAQLKQNVVPICVSLHSVHCDLGIECQCPQSLRCNRQLNGSGEIETLCKNGIRNIASHCYHKVQAVVVAVGIDIVLNVPKFSVPITHCDIERRNGHIFEQKAVELDVPIAPINTS